MRIVYTFFSVILLRALRAHVPLFRKSLTRKWYRKKITENALYVPLVP